MGNISRRNFLKDSLILTTSSLLLSSKYLEPSTKPALDRKGKRNIPSLKIVIFALEIVVLIEQKVRQENAKLLPKSKYPALFPILEKSAR